MAIVRGQWYQWKAHPDQFYRVSVVNVSYIQLYPYDTTKYQVMYVAPTYLQLNFRLLASAPQNFLLDGAVDSKTSVTRAYVLDDLVVWGSASASGSVSHSADLLDTTLRGKVRNLIRITRASSFLSRIQARGSVLSYSTAFGNFTPKPTLAAQVISHFSATGSDFTVYPLGGNLAGQGRVVQAQAN